MSNKTVTFLRETRVHDLYAEGAHASFDADTADALIAGGYAVAGRKDVEGGEVAEAPVEPEAPAKTSPAPKAPARR